MNRNMGYRFQTIDQNGDRVCRLHGGLCNTDCRKCVFALSHLMKKSESDDAWYTVFGIRNVPLDVTSPDKPFTFLGQCQHRPEAMECKARNASRFDRVIVVKGTASPADLFEIMEEVD